MAAGSAEEEEHECAPGWKLFRGRCYWSTSKDSALGAEIQCQKSGGRLVEIADEAEQEFLQVEFPGTFWIGMRQVNFMENWRECNHPWCGWAWQSNYEAPTYENWDRSKVRDHGRNVWPYTDRANSECAHMVNPPNADGRWDDAKCTDSWYKGICSQPKEQVGKPFRLCPLGKVLFRGACWGTVDRQYRTFAEAQEACVADGGEAAVLRDELDEKFVLYHMGLVRRNQYKRYWVAYTNSSGTWAWLNSSGVNHSHVLEHAYQYKKDPVTAPEDCTYGGSSGWIKTPCRIEDDSYSWWPRAICNYPSTVRSATCRTNERLWRGGCYWLSEWEKGRGYDLAELNCEKGGGFVAKMPDAETSRWAYETFVVPHDDDSVFIGLRQDMEHPSCAGLNVTARKYCGWVWEQDRANVSYLPWTQGQPDDGFKFTKTEDETGFDNCAALVYRKYDKDSYQPGEWEDRHCGTTLRAICRRDATVWEPFEARCAPGQLQIQSRCFWLTPRQTSWETAQNMCNQFGASLAKLRDMYEQEQLVKAFRDDFTYLWIGLGRHTEEPEYCKVKPQTSRDRCNWKWDEDGWEPTINYWAGGMNATGKRQCIAWNMYNQAWYPQHCLRPRRGLCSIKASPDPTPVCMPGQKYFNKKCFWVTTKAFTFQGGEIECNRAGGTLAALSTEAEDDFAASEFIGWQDGPVFIGYKQTAKDDAESCNTTELNGTQLMKCGWEWTDKSAPGGWMNWNLGEPNDFPNMLNEKGDEDCAAVYPKGQWGDRSCLEKLPALCSKVATLAAQPKEVNRCDKEAEQQERLLGEFKYLSVHARSVQLLTAPAEHGDKLDFIDEVFVNGNDDLISSKISTLEDATDTSEFVTTIPMASDSIKEFNFKQRGQIEYPSPYPKFTVEKGESIDAVISARDLWVDPTEGKNRLRYSMFSMMPTGMALNLKVKLEKRDSILDLVQVVLSVAGYDSICVDDVVMMVVSPGAGKLGKRALKKGMKTAMKSKKLSKSSKRRLKENYKDFKKWKKTEQGEEIMGEIQGEAEGQFQDLVVEDVVKAVLGVNYCIDIVDTIEPFASKLLGKREALYELQLVMEGDTRHLDVPVTNFTGGTLWNQTSDEDVYLSIDVRDMAGERATFYGNEGVNFWFIRNPGSSVLSQKARTVHIANFQQQDFLDISEFADLGWTDFDKMPLREVEDVSEEEYVMRMVAHSLEIRLTLDCGFDLKPSHFIFRKDLKAPPKVTAEGQNQPTKAPDVTSGAWPGVGRWAPCFVTAALAAALL